MPFQIPLPSPEAHVRVAGGLEDRGGSGTARMRRIPDDTPGSGFAIGPAGNPDSQAVHVPSSSSSSTEPILSHPGHLVHVKMCLA